MARVLVSWYWLAAPFAAGALDLLVVDASELPEMLLPELSLVALPPAPPAPPVCLSRSRHRRAPPAPPAGGGRSGLRLCDSCPSAQGEDRASC